MKMRWLCLPVFFASSFVTGRAAHADIIVQGVADNGVQSIYGNLDLTTGQFTETAGLGTIITALTEDSTGKIYGGTTTGTLVSFAPDGTASNFGTGTPPLPPGSMEYGYFGLAAVSTGFLAVNYNSTLQPGLVSIDPTNTTVTNFGTNFSTYNIRGSGELAFGPDNVLYLEAQSEQGGIEELFRINLATGVATPVSGALLGSTNNHPLAGANGGTPGSPTPLGGTSGPAGVM